MKTVHYRVVHAGRTLSVWKTNEANLSSLLHHELNCPDEHTRELEDAVTRCELAAEKDYGDILPWIVPPDSTSSLIVYTGPLAVRQPA